MTIRYRYDAEGNLIKKIMPKGVEWNYFWNAAGLLTKVIRPDGETVSFSYDALGRRLSKTYKNRTTCWVWDRNVPVHEWVEEHLTGKTFDTIGHTDLLGDQIAIQQREAIFAGRVGHAPPKAEKINFTTWIFKPGTFAPLTKISGPQAYSIITNHVDTPLCMYDKKGKIVWAAELDIYGQIYEPTLTGRRVDCPFRYPGQFEDEETGLYYNRFRYYDPESGEFCSQDPIVLGGSMQAYSYAHDPNSWIDPFGLEIITYITYVGMKDDGPYVGKASGVGSADDVLKRRYSSNFQNAGFNEKPQIIYEGQGDSDDPLNKAKCISRGTEQKTYEKLVEENGAENVSNKNNPVGERNPNRDTYLDAADEHEKKK